MASMGSGISGESKIPITPAPRYPSFISAGITTSFHSDTIRAKKLFNPGPSPASHPSIIKASLYGPPQPGSESGYEPVRRLGAHFKKHLRGVRALAHFAE